MKRTAAIDLDQDFSVETDITKTWVDPTTGQRLIRGVASGVLPDRQNERCSRNAIAKMAAQASAGGAIKLTSSHDQDWATEFGDVVKGYHDEETDEFVIDAALPPEGVDPLADKAWNTMTKAGVQMGFSIGGKLRKAYYELTDVGKRKVLDEVDLRHVQLTTRPAYPQSFAECVAKSVSADDWTDPDTLEVFEADDVAKATPPAAVKQPSSTGDPNAGENADGNQKDVETPDNPDGTADDKEDPQQALEPAGRHLSCPNCGHEFAADLPTDDETGLSTPETDDDGDTDTDRDTKKSLENPLMNLPETLAHLRDLVEKTDTPEAEVEKTAPEAEADVEKTYEDASDVLKVVAASHKDLSDGFDSRFGALEESLGKAFETIADVLKSQNERLAALPLGRRSVARIVEPPVAKRTETEDHEETVAKRVEGAESLADAIKVINEEQYGIR